MPRLPKVTSVVKRSDILERRLANPFGMGSIAIPCTLKDRKNQPLYKFRIRNTDIHHSQAHRAILAGWEYAQPEDIDGNIEDYGFELRNGRLVSGPRGQEVLVKIPMKDFEAIQQAKSDRNAQQMKGRATKQAIVENAGRELGDEGASFLQRSLSNIDIKDTREVIPADEQ